VIICHTERMTEQIAQHEQIEQQPIEQQPIEQQAVAAALAPTNTQAVFSSVDKADRISGTRTLYDASAGEIFWRNFLSGFARGLGMILVYVIFIVLVSLLAARFIVPVVQPFINQYSNLMKSFSSIQQVIPSQSSQNQTNQFNQLYQLQNQLMNGQTAK
jgi:hypothetical protein